MINPMNLNCIQRCPEGYYPNYENECERCTGKCDSCVSPWECTECNEFSEEVSIWYDPWLNAELVWCHCKEGYYESYTDGTT